MERLDELPNLGPVLAEKLHQCGIATQQQLHEMGSRAAFLKLFAKDPTVCIHHLLALEGAVQGVRWHHLPVQVKEGLRVFFHTVR